MSSFSLLNVRFLGALALRRHITLLRGFVLVGLFCASSYVGSAATGRNAIDDTTLSGPVALELEITVSAAIDQVLSGTELQADNGKNALAADLAPSLRIWSPDIQDHFGQYGVRLVRCQPPPTTAFSDPVTGNRIMYWDLSPELRTSRTLEIRRLYRLNNAGYIPHVSAAGASSGKYTDSAQVARCLLSEPGVELSDDMTSAARIAVGDTTMPLEKARKVFRFVRKHMEYVYPPPGDRGASTALALGKGDCGQYADLFVALCRSAGVPARMAPGYRLELPKPGEGKTTCSAGCHAWAEFMLPTGEWLPADATGDEENFFARCAVNAHITASFGRNIELPQAPRFATLKFSDVDQGRTPFMQTYCECFTGIRARTKAARVVRFLDSGR